MSPSYESWTTIMVTGLQTQEQADQVNQALGDLARALAKIPEARGEWTIDHVVHSYNPQRGTNERTED